MGGTKLRIVSARMPALAMVALKHSQRLAKRFNFLFGSGFFTLDLFQGFKSFLDFVEGLLQFGANVFYLLDGVGNCSGTFGMFVAVRRAVLVTMFFRSRFGRAFTAVRTTISAASTSASAAAKSGTPASTARTPLFTRPWRRTAWLFCRCILLIFAFSFRIH